MDDSTWPDQAPQTVKTQDDTDENQGLKDWFDEYIMGYVTRSKESSLLHSMFDLHMRDVTAQRVQHLLALIAALIFLFWPEDFLLDKTDQLFWSFFYWRIVTISLCLVGIIFVEFFSFARNRLNVLFVLLVALDMSFAGYLFGRVEGLDFPWFDFLAFITPMFSVILPLQPLKRFAAAVLVTIPYVSAYLVVDLSNLEFAYLAQFSPLLLASIFLSVMVGHSIYHFDFENFVIERQMKVQQQRIEHLARYDQLTGLYNRREFGNQSERIFNEAQRYDFDLSLLMIDLDNFKLVNDEYGHPAGDEVLSRLGTIIKNNVRKVDVAGRLGGEEFCIILQQTSADGAQKLARRLKNKLSNHEFKTAKDETFSVTCSIGLAELDDEIRGPEDFFRLADDALYQAKESGKDQIVIAEQ